MSNLGLFVTTIDYFMFKILDIFKKGKKDSRLFSEKIFLTHKYDHFRAVLTGNNKALDIITDLEHIFYGIAPLLCTMSRPSLKT